MRIAFMNLLIPTALALAIAVPGCGDKPKPKPAADDHRGHDHGPDGKHVDEKTPGHGHGGKVIALGDGAFGPYKVTATRDEGAIKPGGDAAIDVSIDPAASTTPAPKVAGVRFWIGTKDAKGSVKAKAEIEDPKHPATWHTHAEVPDPLPAGAKLWIEIADDKGTVTVASFDLKG